MEKKTRDYNFEIKSVDEKGYIEGYGSVFGVKDYYDEIVVKGAFEASLQRKMASGSKFPLLWGHSSWSNLGVWEEATEDDYGLLLKGRLLVDDIREAREKHALAKAKAISGLSIGFKTIKSHYDKERKALMLTEIELFEVSLVTFPANEEARVTSAKNAGVMPTERELERILRESGFSKSKALEIIAVGYKSVMRGDHAKGNGYAELMQSIDNLTLTATNK